MSTSGTESAQTNLYKAWMTGYAYQASRNIYFGPGPQLDASQSAVLLNWLLTYSSLVAGWKPFDPNDEIGKGIEEMIDEVEGNKQPHAVTRDQFDEWHLRVVAAMTAAMPSASYTSQFASSLAGLGHVETEDEFKDLSAQLDGSLEKLKSEISADTYTVIRWCRQHPLLSSYDGRPGTRNLPKTADYYNNVDPIWSALILGMDVESDYFGLGDRFVEGLIFVVAGAFLFGLAVLPIAFAAQLPEILKQLPLASVPNGGTVLDTNTITSALPGIIPVLTGVGLTATVVAKKAWDLLKWLDSKAAVSLAERRILEMAKNPKA